MADMGTRVKPVLVLTVLLLVGAVATYFSLAATGILDGREEVGSRLAHDEEVPLDQSGAGEHFNVGFTVYERESPIQQAYVIADIMVDDDFIVTNGSGWRDDITEMVEGANGLLGQVGIEIRIGSVGIWVSDEGAGSLLNLMESAESQMHRDPSRLLLVITCQDPPRQDGLAQGRPGRLIIEYYHRNVPRNSALLSHEVGHLFGAGHHEDAVECIDDGCIMDEKGYEHEEEWCDHHRDLIQGNVQAALATAGGADPDAPRAVPEVSS